jgi:hypothetical protein
MSLQVRAVQLKLSLGQLAALMHATHCCAALQKPAALPARVHGDSTGLSSPSTHPFSAQTPGSKQVLLCSQSSGGPKPLPS